MSDPAPQTRPDARALEGHARRIAREARIQHRLGGHAAAASAFERAIGLMERARVEWSARGEEKRAGKLSAAIEAQGRLLRVSEAIGAEGRARRLGRFALSALPLLLTLGLWINALVESMSIPSTARWWLLGGLILTLAASVGGLAARWRPQTLGLLSAALLLAALLASILSHPTLGTGGAVALGLESLQLAHLAHIVALALPILYATRWWSVWWVPLAPVGLWCMAPFALGLAERLPIEDLPLQVAFWADWPGFTQPLFVMVFVYIPICVVLVALTTLGHLIASDAEPEGSALVEPAPEVHP